MAVLCSRRATVAAAAALLCAGTAVAQYDFGGMGGDYPDMDDYGMDEYGMGGGGGASDSPDAHIRGVLDLDDVTFDKVITGEAAAFGASRRRAALPVAIKPISATSSY